MALQWYVCSQNENNVKHVKNLIKCNSAKKALNSVIDNYAKDGGPGVVWLLCSFYREPLRFSLVKEAQ